MSSQQEESTDPSTRGGITPAVELAGVSRTAPDGRFLLREVSLTIRRGGITSLVGPSGAGKSTLLRLINRLDDADEGEVSVLGRPMASWPVGVLRRKVAMVSQEPNLMGLSVRDNLLLPGRLRKARPSLHGLENAETRNEGLHRSVTGMTVVPEMPKMTLERALELAELECETLDRDPATLSVGQKQRATLARALMTTPEILLLDEPTAGLDPRTAERVMERLLALNGETGMTLVIATHRFDEIPRSGCRLGVLIDGRLHGEGEAGQMLANPPTAAADAFLKGPARKNDA